MDHPPTDAEMFAAYVRPLIDGIEIALPAWLQRCVVDTAIRARGECPPELRQEAAGMAAAATSAIMATVTTLLEQDAAAQRANPLSLLRAAVGHPTELLRRHGFPAVPRDEFASRTFPDDVYALSPATWNDIDEALLEPGIVWGAWKAKVMLDRRRSAPGTSPTT